MEDFKKWEHQALVEKLAEQTNLYMHMLKNGASQKEFDACKNLIDRLSIEINNRKIAGTANK